MQSAMSLECWEPLEASSESLNTLLQALGVPAWKFVQVLDLDDEAAVAQAVAFILLHPTIPDVEKYLRRPTPAITIRTDPPSLFFARQLVGGSCGTIAVLHALMNVFDKDTIPNDSPLQGLVENDDYSTENAAILQRSQRVVGNASIQDAHRVAAGQGRKESTKSLAGQRQGRHFVTFVKNDEELLWELDGRRDHPVCRGSNATFLSEIKSILTSTDDPKVHFGSSVVALVPAE